MAVESTPLVRRAASEMPRAEPSTTRGQRANTAIGDILEGAGDLVGLGTRVASDFFTAKMKADVDEAHQSLNQEFGVDDALSLYGGLNTEDTPQDIVEAKHRLDLLHKAKKSGAFSPIAFDAQVELLMRQLRQRYPGRSELGTLDEYVTQKFYGTSPANRIRDQLLADTGGAENRIANNMVNNVVQWGTDHPDQVPHELVLRAANGDSEAVSLIQGIRFSMSSMETDAQRMEHLVKSGEIDSRNAASSIAQAYGRTLSSIFFASNEVQKVKELARAIGRGEVNPEQRQEAAVLLHQFLSNTDDLKARLSLVLQNNPVIADYVSTDPKKLEDIVELALNPLIQFTNLSDITQFKDDDGGWNVIKKAFDIQQATQGMNMVSQSELIRNTSILNDLVGGDLAAKLLVLSGQSTPVNILDTMSKINTILGSNFTFNSDAMASNLDDFFEETQKQLAAMNVNGMGRTLAETKEETAKTVLDSIGADSATEEQDSNKVTYAVSPTLFDNSPSLGNSSVLLANRFSIDTVEKVSTTSVEAQKQYLDTFVKGVLKHREDLANIMKSGFVSSQPDPFRIDSVSGKVTFKESSNISERIRKDGENAAKYATEFARAARNVFSIIGPKVGINITTEQEALSLFYGMIGVRDFTQEEEGIMSALFGANAATNPSGVVEDELVPFPSKGAAYSPSVIVDHSFVNVPLDQDNGDFKGNSRVWGDAPVEVQRKVRDAILSEADSRGLDDKDKAMLLAIAHHESGFNPSAAAGTTSASGIGQFIKATGKVYGLNNANRWKLNAQVKALVEHYIDNKKLAEGKGEEYIYAYHHDGPSLKYGGLTLAKRKVVPLARRYLEQITKTA